MSLDVWMREDLARLLVALYSATQRKMETQFVTPPMVRAYDNGYLGALRGVAEAVGIDLYEVLNAQEGVSDGDTIGIGCQAQTGVGP